MTSVGSYEKHLRNALDVPDDATVEDILGMIRKEGWEPRLIPAELEGQEVWAWPVAQGIFATVEVDPETGKRGQAGSLSPEIAALEGLRKAKGWPPMKKQVDQFVVVTEDGHEETVFVYVDLVDASTLSEPGKIIEGKLKEHRTVEGHPVNVLTDGSYEILSPLGSKNATKKE